MPKETEVLKTEDGKEIKLNFVDREDPKILEDEAKEAGIEVESSVIKFPTESEEELTKEQMEALAVKQAIGHLNQGQYQTSVEIGAVITIMLQRGLITHKEMQEAVSTVDKQMKKVMEDGAQLGPEMSKQVEDNLEDSGVIVGRKKPTCHGDCGGK